MRSPISLKKFLSVQFALLGVVPLIIVALLEWFLIIPDIQSSIASSHKVISRSISEQMETHLASARHQMMALARYLKKAALSQEQQAMALNAQCGQSEFFDAVYIIDRKTMTLEGSCVSRSYLTRNRANRDQPPSATTFSDTLQKQSTSNWSDPFFSPVIGQSAMAILVPAGRNLLVGEIGLNTLSSQLKSLQTQSDLRSLIFNAKGVILADSRLQKQGIKLPEYSRPNITPKDATSGSAVPLELDGEKLHTHRTKIAETGWTVLVSQPDFGRSGLFNETILYIATGITIALLLSLTISHILAGRLSFLFATYAEKAQAIADGNYNLQWPQPMTKEFQVLSSNLQRMTEQISMREKDLIDSENLLKITLHSIGDAVITTDAQGTITGINSMAEFLTGYNSAEAIGRALSEVFQVMNGTTGEATENPVEKVLLTGQTVVLANNTILLSRDGKEYQIADSGAPIRHKDGTIVGVVLVFRDVTKSYAQQQQIRESEERLQDLLANVPGMVYQFSTEPTISVELIETKAADLLGLDKDSDDFFNEFVAGVPENDRPGFLESIGVAVENISPWHYEGRYIKPSGEEIWIEGNSVPRQVGDRIIFYGLITDNTHRMKMEYSLKLAKVIFDTAPIGIWRMGSGGEILDVNEQGCTSLGYTREELCNMRVFDFAPEFDTEAWAHNQEILNEVGRCTIESHHRRKNGVVFPIQVRQKLVHFKDQIFHVAFVEDITERKRSEDALRKKEALLTNILESMNEGVLVLDQEFRYTVFNKMLEKMTSTPKQAVLGKIPWQEFPTLKNTPVESSIREAMQGKSTGNLEVFLSFSPKPDLWCSDSFTPLKDETGQVIGVVGVVRDITRQKEDAEELSRLRNYLSNIIESMPSVLVGVDHEGRVTLWNQQTEQVTGLTFEEARNQPLKDVYVQLASEMEKIKSAIEQRRVISSHKVAHKRGLETRYEDITIFPLVANGVEGAVIRLDDVTEKVYMEEMMIQSEKMLTVGGLAAGMAHEINNPLAGMLQTAEVMTNRLNNNLGIPANTKAAKEAGTTLEAIEQFMTIRKIPRMLATISNSGRRVAEIVDNMLSFARKDDGTMSSHHLEHLMEKAIELATTDYDLKKQYDFKQIELIREFAENVPPVPCQESKIQQVLLNILSNGAQAMQAAGTKQPCFILRTLLDPDKGMACMEIEDNGPGMDNDIVKHIFEPFFTTKPKGVGTGLGLSVSYFIITENHKGEMAVESRPGIGSKFIIRLPA